MHERRRVIGSLRHRGGSSVHIRQSAATEMNDVIEHEQADAPRDAARDHAATPPQRYSRRLSDKILIAFHHACDQSDFEVAQQLLQILEMMLARRPLTPDGTRRRNMESLVAAHERLWHLRHADLEPV